MSQRRTAESQSYPPATGRSAIVMSLFALLLLLPACSDAPTDATAPTTSAAAAEDESTTTTTASTPTVPPTTSTGPSSTTSVAPTTTSVAPTTSLPPPTTTRAPRYTPSCSVSFTPSLSGWTERSVLPYREATFNIRLSSDEYGVSPPSATGYYYSFTISSGDAVVNWPYGSDYITTVGDVYGGNHEGSSLSPLPTTEIGDYVTVSITVSMDFGNSCSASGTMQVKEGI